MNDAIDISGWADTVARCAATIDPYQAFEAAARQAERALASLPFEALAPLLDFKRHGAPGGRLLLRGALTDPALMPTVASLAEIQAGKGTFYSEFHLIMLAKLLGEPFSYRQEKGGVLIQNLRPTRENERVISSESSSIVLDLHNENIYHPFCPDYLILIGLRRDPSRTARTLVVGADEIVGKLRPDDVEELRKLQFRTSVDYTFGNHDAARGSGPLIRILFGDRAAPMIAYDDEYVIGTNERAQAALSRLRAMLHENLVEVELAPGEILIVDNLKAIHGRTAFAARYDGTDRWLQRILVTRDLRRAEALLDQAARTIEWSYHPGRYYGYVDHR